MVRRTEPYVHLETGTNYGFLLNGLTQETQIMSMRSFLNDALAVLFPMALPMACPSDQSILVFPRDCRAHSTRRISNGNPLATFPTFRTPMPMPIPLRSAMIPAATCTLGTGSAPGNKAAVLVHLPTSVRWTPAMRPTPGPINFSQDGQTLLLSNVPAPSKAALTTAFFWTMPASGGAATQITGGGMPYTGDAVACPPPQPFRRREQIHR